MTMRVALLLTLLTVGDTLFGGNGSGQRVAIPSATVDGGKLPSSSVFIGGRCAGDITSGAILSNRRFFGLIWSGRSVDGTSFRALEGDPQTLFVDHSKVFQLFQVADSHE